jgi:hypothetical protein
MLKLFKEDPSQLQTMAVATWSVACWSSSTLMMPDHDHIYFLEGCPTAWKRFYEMFETALKIGEMQEMMEDSEPLMEDFCGMQHDESSEGELENGTKMDNTDTGTKMDNTSNPAAMAESFASKMSTSLAACALVVFAYCELLN